MSRTGVEAKIPWQQVPRVVRQQVDLALGASVTRATRIWGGYAPTPTYRLLLADGRRAFFKGTCRDSNAFMKRALLLEERVYRDLADVLSTWIPQLYATFRYDDWHALILEDLGPQSVPPWTAEKTRAITHALAAFHQSSLGAQPPAWLPLPDEDLAQENWQQMAQESLEFQNIAALAGKEAPQALQWFRQITPTIEHMMQQSVLKEGAYAILHGDLRSDNLRLRQGQLYLFDWPSISIGRPEWDIVAFAQTVAVEGGPAPEQVMAWYGEQFPSDPQAIECALAWWLTFFARRAWQAEVPGLPRLRRFQRQQLAVLAYWSARQWSFPVPEWAGRLLL
ncbi:MAG: phosphotransferase [Ktedonobacteraceae bacterium]